VAKNQLAALDVNFIIGNYNTSHFANETLDLAFSNLGFNWSVNLEETFKMMFKQLKRGGILAFSIPIDDNFKQLKKNSEISVINQKKFIFYFKTPVSY